jgi:hypothetical protein
VIFKFVNALLPFPVQVTVTTTESSRKTIPLLATFVPFAVTTIDAVTSVEAAGVASEEGLLQDGNKKYDETIIIAKDNFFIFDSV